MLDALIIGGGPVGCYCAGKLQEMKLSYRLLEASASLGGQCSSLYPEKEIVDIPGLPPLKSKDVIARLLAKVDPANVSLSTAAASLRSERGQVIAITDQGEFAAKHCIIATGLGFYTPRTMGLAGEEKCPNILYSVKDFGFLKNKKVAIFGGGDSALDWAKEISKVSPFVSLIHRRTEFRGHPETIAGCPIALYLPFIPESLALKDGRCSSVNIKKVDGEERINLPIDYILVNYGSVPAPSLFGFKPGPTFGILVDEKRKAAERVFAVGDCASYEGKQKRIAPGFLDADAALSEIKRLS